MTDSAAERPPYGVAAAVTLAVLAGYVATLAPTVTFWDAGEFIAAAKTLGIPHPPGTPLFVLIAHVWGMLVPVGEYAVRTNFLSALFSALGAGAAFLVAHEATRPWGDAAFRRLAAAAAALCGAFTFTNWQNSNETEVYAVATCTISVVAWLALRWRAARGTTRAPRLLLLILFLGGVSIGNHLLALLSGPALVTFLVAVLRLAPAADPAARRREWAQVAVVAGTWALLIGSGLGSSTLATLGLLCYLAAAAFAFTAGAGAFALCALALAAVGISPYLFMYLRSAQQPILNEAAPSTWGNLLAVIRRAQYPVRTPLDDPTEVHGADNPGRSATLIGLQLLNYLQYFDWQWAKGFVAAVAGFPLRTLVTLVFVSAGLRGWLELRRTDRAVFWLLLALWTITGLGLVAYMNFKPGFSLGFDRYPEPGDHEVRERDYFFVVSFTTWGLVAGLGVAAWARALAARLAASLRPAAAGLLALALLPVGLNWTAATRRGGADQTLPADFAYDMLNTVPPYGILFTYGDNDTFPLWWAQEVAGIRRDVTVVCLALGQTDWYMRQLRDLPVRDFDAAAAPAPWRGVAATKPAWPLHTMTDQEVDAAASQPFYVRDPLTIALGPIQHTLRPGTVLMPNDVLTLRIIQQNLGRRPIVFGLTTGREFAGLKDYVVQQGMGFLLLTERPDTTGGRYVPGGIGGAPLDAGRTDTLAWGTYRYGSLLAGDTEGLESTSASIAASLSIPFTQLAFAADRRGDSTATIRNLERANQIAPNPAVEAVLRQARLTGKLPAEP